MAKVEVAVEEAVKIEISTIRQQHFGAADQPYR